MNRSQITNKDIMNRDGSISVARSVFVLCLLTYMISAAFLLKYYQYQINPDGISYISIAQKYLRGDFTNAVNGYWGPLFSWLLVPFLLTGLQPLLAAKALLVIIGLLSLVGVRLLFSRFETTETIRNVILFSLVPAVLYCSLIIVSPDILIMCTLTFYLFIIVDKDYPDKRYRGALCGVICGMAYLSKGYAFPFFLAHFPLLSAFHYINSKTRENKRAVLRHFIHGLVVFCIICGSWATALSAKYGTITLGTTKRYNHAINRPGSLRHPMLHQGFFEPPDPTAISAWEDPSYFEVESWSPFESWDFFKHQLKRIWSNVSSRAVWRPSLFPLFLPSILAYVLFCLRFNRKILGSVPFYTLVTIIVYCSGYFLMCVRERLLWIAYILGILVGAYVLNQLLRKEYFDRLKRNIILALFIFISVGPALGHLDAGVNTMKDIYELSEVLRDEYGIQGRVGSDSYYRESLYLAFYLNVPYHGEAREDIDARELASDLRKHNIDYYFVWGKDERAEKLIDYEEITHNDLEDLRIYRFREKK